MLVTPSNRIFRSGLACVLLVASIATAFSCSREAQPTSASSSELETGITSVNFVHYKNKQQKPEIFRISPGVCSTIGTSGGTLANGPVTLHIPPGAVGQNTEICITAVNAYQMIVEFSPAGLVFGVNATMEWDLTGTSAEEEADDVQTYWHNSATGAWDEIQMLEPLDENTTQSVIEHFSKYSQGVDG